MCSEIFSYDSYLILLRRHCRWADIFNEQIENSSNILPDDLPGLDSSIGCRVRDIVDPREWRLALQFETNACAAIGDACKIAADVFIKSPSSVSSPMDSLQSLVAFSTYIH